MITFLEALRLETLSAGIISSGALAVSKQSIRITFESDSEGVFSLPAMLGLKYTSWYFLIMEGRTNASTMLPCPSNGR